MSEAETAEALARNVIAFGQSLARQEIAQQIHRIRPALARVPRVVIIIGDVDCPELPKPLYVKQASSAQLLYDAFVQLKEVGAWTPKKELTSDSDYRNIANWMLKTGKMRGVEIKIVQ